MNMINELFDISECSEKITTSQYQYNNITDNYKEPTLTEWLNSINYDKTYLLDNLNIKKYPQYIINMCLYKNRDILYYIDVLNCLDVNNKMHYDFLLNSIPAKKRWAPFSKKNKNIDDVDLVKKYFNVSYNRALKYYMQLDKEDIEIIKKIFEVGGIKNNNRKK